MISPLLIKSLHIIFVVSWFSGLFYMVRLFVYQREAIDKNENERNVLVTQFKLMQWRLWYIITWPMAILTTASGFYLVYLYSYWTNPWMILKFSLVGGLLIYQVICHNIFKQQQKDVYKWKSFQLRLWNELATIFLFLIVFVVVFKDLDSWYWALGGVVVLAILMMIIAKWYKKKREQ